ncbi:MAG: alkaline phosphatase family protein [Actinomycetota bacterium]|nr:alkaline phosphatase family protein [Actinomycetota bacterium]
MDDPLLLGPVLRYVDATTAAVWVEVARRGTVAVGVDGRSHEAHTFTVHGHHYALVEIEGLRPGTSAAYDVRVEGQRVWPPDDSPFPPSRVRTLSPGRRHRVLFGSCRTSVPHDAAHNRSHGIDVLRAYALGLPDVPEDAWPDLVMFLGDQVYADETSQQMREFIAARRDIARPPYEELRDYEEYAHLYRLAWTEPANRWLLSTLPSAMIFDDHDVRDDWNTSRAWREEMARVPWWHDRIVGALASYWVYQHLGNLSTADRAQDPLWAEVRRVGRDGDAGEMLDAFADRCDRDPAYHRWSYHRDLGRSRMIVLDTRSGRMLDEGDRRMLDEGEMSWFESLATGDVDHLLVGTSLPLLLPTGLHHVEAWSEAVAGGAWGARAARFGEKVRQGVDLEHWAAFQQSFQRVARLLAGVARGECGTPPGTVCVLSGDVHHSYLAEAELDARGLRRRGRSRSRDVEGSSRLLQLVCSPIRNPLPRVIRFAAAASAYGLAWPMGRLAARSAKVSHPPFRWSLTAGPWFDNAVATLDLDGRRARVTWFTAELRDGEEAPSLSPLHSATLA